MARSPNQAPLPSSPTGNPQPLTWKRLPSGCSTSPTLPVPAATMAPGRPPCAPSSMVWASVSRTSRAKPGFWAWNCSDHGRWLTPERPAPMAQTDHAGGSTRTEAKAALMACKMCCQAWPTPWPKAEGPACPYASKLPSGKPTATRVPVPPPSTPIKYSIMVVLGTLQVCLKWYVLGLVISIIPI